MISRMSTNSPNPVPARSCSAPWRLVAGRLVAREKDGGELVERQLAVRSWIRLGAPGAKQRLVGVRLGVHLPELEPSLRHGHRARERAADEEATPENLTHVAHLVQ